ncbi:MAG: DUF4199 domain-containing protein [Saprospiraceae bacterium]|nr:DUF4199 domain-containing protein [Saprospiraceae bacterium]
MTNLNVPDSASVSPWPSILRLGLIGGLIFIVVAMVSNLTGFSVPTSMMGVIASLVVSIALAVGLCIYAVRQHREQELGGYITFPRALLVGFMVLLIASLVSGVFNYMYVGFIDPGFAEAAIQKTSEWMESMGMTASQIEEQLTAMEARLTPMGMLKQSLIGAPIISLIIGLIVAAVMKRNRPVLDDVLDN